MAKVDTEVMFDDKDLGKNLYRKTTYYKMMITQEVLAKDKDEADQMFLDNGGIDHSAINSSLTETKNGVETLFVDADYQDSSDTDYIGKVVYEDDEYAKEDGLVEIDTYAEETEVRV